MARNHQLKIGVSGVRGVVGDYLTPELVMNFAQAFGTYMGPGTVVVGRDTRESGDMLLDVAIAGLSATGCRVVNIGIAPTPTIQCAVTKLNAVGGIAITASHNPEQYNALKFFNGTGVFINGYEREELIDIYYQRDFRLVEARSYGSVETIREEGLKHFAFRNHLEKVLEHVDAEMIRKKNFKVGLDCVNGTGSVFSPYFLKEGFGCRVEGIHLRPSAPFPRGPEPVPKNLKILGELVQREKCDIGFAQDPDADRLGIVDETGRPLDTEIGLALVVDYCLQKFPGDVVVNNATSLVIDDVAARHGRQVHRAKVGEANVIELMQSNQTCVGGEGSAGGVIFPPLQMCRDSFIGMAMILQYMAETGLTLSKLVERYPVYYRDQVTLHLPMNEILKALRVSEKYYLEKCGKLRLDDGIKASFDGGWVLIRPSNTEPIMRIQAEAKTKERLQELMDEAGRVVKG